MNVKVDSRPLLFEISYKKDLKKDKINNITSFVNTLKRNGIKDPKSNHFKKGYLNKEER